MVDLNIWDYLAMPTGVVLCFGPILFVWLKEEFTGHRSGPPPDQT